MDKLREIEIVGFRGARFKLPVNLTSKCRSVAIYGENAAGKSTITDALEWYLFDRVDHLWREDCKEEALRNVLLGEDESCSVSLRFDDGSLDGTKSLSASLKVSQSKQSANAKAFLERIQDERTILRHAQITKFIGETKSKKRQEVASIIGYEEIVGFRDTIQSVSNSLRKDAGYAGAKHLAEGAKNRLFELTNAVIANEEELFKKATGLVVKFDVVSPINDDNGYDEALDKLHAKVAKPESAEKKLKLEQFRRHCEELAVSFPKLAEARDKFLEPYNKLAANKAAVSQLNIEQFLSQGSEILAEGHFSEEKCPFCLAPYDLNKLKAEVEKRISKIEAIKKTHVDLGLLKDEFVSVVTSVGTACGALSENYPDLDDAIQLAEAASSILPLLRDWIRKSGSAYDSFQTLEFDSNEDQRLEKVVEIAKTSSEAAKKKIESLELSKKEQDIINTIGQVKEMRDKFREFQEQTKIVRTYEKQILSLSAMFDEFVAVQNSALQSVLDQISGDVGTYYSALHPNENVDQVRLRVVGDEGIEFEYHFHGKPTYPPMKYLSESHLNSLGICLFLASAKLFNKVGKFLVLDDIVTSFDLGHRRRLVRLLKDQFSDWQIILLTHEHLWFEIIRRELASSGWLFREVDWSPENGIRIADTPEDWKALIAEKRKKYDVSNDIRKLLESYLKEIAYALEIKVPFRFNDSNESRMSGELLNALKSAINDKAPSLKGHPIFAQLEGSNLVATVGSHDNPADKIAGGDIDVALNDIDALISLFSCEDCKKFVEAGRPVAGEKKISCQCGKTHLDWKH